MNLFNEYQPFIPQGPEQSRSSKRDKKGICSKCGSEEPALGQLEAAAAESSLSGRLLRGLGKSMSCSPIQLRAGPRPRLMPSPGKGTQRFLNITSCIPDLGSPREEIGEHNPKQTIKKENVLDNITSDEPSIGLPLSPASLAKPRD